MNKKISFSCNVNITNLPNNAEDYVLKSEYGHFNVPKYSDGSGREIVRTISFPPEGNWYLITAGKNHLNGVISLDVVFSLDGEVKIYNFEEHMRFDVPVSQTVDAVLNGSFDIPYEELPDLIETLKSGFVPPETDAEENPDAEEVLELEDGEEF